MRTPSISTHSATPMDEDLPARPLAGTLPTLRHAVAADLPAIRALVRAERLNPNDLRWQNFVVATLAGTVVGAAQIRHHEVGSHELGSLVVAPAHRGRGIADRMIGHLLDHHHGPVHVVTAVANARHYRRWGFHRVPVADAPPSVRANFWIGQIAGGVFSLLRGRAPRRLVILARA